MLRLAEQNITFTFHNVSINSRKKLRPVKNYVYLHSIMYLLILSLLPVLCMFGRLFTFHNVSINSRKFHCCTPLPLYLHSIMYLLIRENQLNAVNTLTNLHSIMYLLILGEHQLIQLIQIWNLHSIMYLLIHKSNVSPSAYVVFTFHNVSINSRPPTTIISSIVFLLFLSTSFYSPHLISIFLL